MKITPLPLALVAFLSASVLFAETKPASAPVAPAAPAPATAKPAVPTVKLPPQAPDVAAPKLGPDGQPNAGFIKSHENFVKIAKEGKAQLLFLGDSITAGWAGNGKDVWAKAFAKYNPANFGIGGDRTQHVLWRIENGELEGFKPKAAVIMIGTNNSGNDPAEGIASGVKKIVMTIRTKTPSTKILLLAVFPRGSKPDGKLNEQNEKLKQVNAIISKLHDGKQVFFLDIGNKFPVTDGNLDKEIMPDFLHLSAKGYEIWADAIAPELVKLMK